MKKIDLENRIKELEQELKLTKEKFNEEKVSHEEHINSIKEQYEKELQDVKNDQYNMWLSVNGEFLNRFLKEELSHKLSIMLSTDWGGEVEAKLLYENETISSDNSSVIIERNGLEE